MKRFRSCCFSSECLPDCESDDYVYGKAGVDPIAGDIGLTACVYQKDWNRDTTERLICQQVEECLAQNGSWPEAIRYVICAYQKDWNRDTTERFISQQLE